MPSLPPPSPSSPLPSRPEAQPPNDVDDGGDENDGGDGGGDDGDGNAGGVPAYVVFHNAKRALHCNTPALVRSATLEAEVQAFVKGCPTKHSTGGERNQAGENMMWSAGPYVNPAYEDANYELAIETWYGQEVGRYNFATGESTGPTGHFTAIVWKSTTQIGCAVGGLHGECTNKFGGVPNTVIVCRYQPGGNWGGKQLQEVGNFASTGCSSERTMSNSTDVE